MVVTEPVRSGIPGNVLRRLDGIPPRDLWFRARAMAEMSTNTQVLNHPFGLFPVSATYGHYKVSLEGAKGEITVAP